MDGDGDRDCDVVVVGGGPVGLLLACELGQAGVSVVVLERLTEVDTTIKAGAINAPSAVALDRRGLLPALARAQAEAFEHMAALRRQLFPDGDAPPMKVPPKFAGHFAGMPLSADRLDATDPAFADVGPAGEVGLVAQEALERLLAERAAQLGVELRRGVELTGFVAEEHGVTVHAGATSIRAGWLVGCDGGRSTVRKLAGFDFPGTPGEITGHQALVEMTDTEGLGSGWTTTGTGIYVNGPIPGRILTVEFDGPPTDREAPITAAELQASMRAVSGVRVTVTKVHSATRFTDNARQASTYRMGRVLLAGDAAHVHSPFGGQGLNLGLGDAMNLGWKLAATVAGRAPDGLLDTYTAERHPIGAWVLDWSRAQVALMRPDRHARALRAVVADLLETTTGTTYFVKHIAGVLHRYDLPGDHPLIGRRAPDLELADGTRLAELLHDGRALLLDLADTPDFRKRAADYPQRVTVRTATSATPAPAALLIRPDGVVAWAADRPTDPVEPLGAALLRWFGEPAAA
ncbi:FAD-dependent oxidoreductase [Embleya sp. NPDC020886]|uniref:FAD-dependent oxidoreductase n=1 Tax=Embleya sp. NPDC020886 TaxID=3363980 RepID=UPI0037A7851B